MRRIKLLAPGVFAVLLTSFIASQTATAQDWAQWRGPNRNGRVNSFAVPAVWPEKLKLRWRTPVGSGVSSPLVSQGKVWIHTRKEDQEIVSCLDIESGKILWSKSYAAPFTPHPAAVKMGNGPFSTPLLSNGRLYTLGVTATLSCFDAESGELYWRKQFGPINTSTIYCGTAASPLIDRGNLIVMVGDDKGGQLIAFDPKTGQEKWKWTSDSVSYSSPIGIEIEGTRQIIAHTNNAVVGVAAETGQLLWKFSFIDPPYGENIVTPLPYRDLLIISNGTQGAAAIRVSKESGQWTAKQVWRNPEIAMYMSSPVIDGDHLFGMSVKQKGRFFCLNAASGQMLWATPGRDGSNAAMLQAGELLLILTDDASLIAAKKDVKGFKPVAKYSVADSPTWAYPAAWGNRILIKDASGVALWSVE